MLIIAVMCISAGVLGASIVLMIMHSRDVRAGRNRKNWDDSWTAPKQRSWTPPFLSRAAMSDLDESPPQGELIELDQYRKR